MMMIAMVAGFAGGIAGRVAFKEQSATAQDSIIVAANSFQFMDAEGNPRMLLTTSDEDKTGLIGMYDEKSQARAAISLSDKGEPTVALSDSAARLRMVMTVLDAEDTAAIFMFDTKDQPIWGIPE